MAVPVTAFIYFAAVFALAFAMGVARALVLAPMIGATAAVLVEVPIVLAASWFVARRVVRGRGLGPGERIAMGAIAFALLMVSEVLLAGALRGQSVVEWAREVATPLGLVGLAGQIGFAAMPVIAGAGRSAK